MLSPAGDGRQRARQDRGQRPHGHRPSTQSLSDCLKTPRVLQPEARLTPAAPLPAPIKTPQGHRSLSTHPLPGVLATQAAPGPAAQHRPALRGCQRPPASPSCLSLVVPLSVACKSTPVHSPYQDSPCAASSPVSLRGTAFSFLEPGSQPAISSLSSNPAPGPEPGPPAPLSASLLALPHLPGQGRAAARTFAEPVPLKCAPLLRRPSPHRRPSDIVQTRPGLRARAPLSRYLSVPCGASPGLTVCLVLVRGQAKQQKLPTRPAGLSPRSALGPQNSPRPSSPAPPTTPLRTARRFRAD